MFDVLKQTKSKREKQAQGGGWFSGWFGGGKSEKKEEDIGKGDQNVIGNNLGWGFAFLDRWQHPYFRCCP